MQVPRYSSRSILWQCAGIIVLLIELLTCVMGGPTAALAQESVTPKPTTIWLRNQTRVVAATISSASPAGLVVQPAVTIAGVPTTRISWDEIDQLDIPPNAIAEDLQTLIGDLHSTLGRPLYQVKHRVRVGDYPLAQTAAEPLLDLLDEHPSPSAYLLYQAMMWGELAQGNREQAMLAYLRILDLLSKRAAKLGDIPGARRLSIDPKSGVCSELLPLLLDEAESKAILADVATLVDSLAEPKHPGTYLYAAAVAQTAGDIAERDRYLEQLPAQDFDPIWKELITGNHALLATDWMSGDLATSDAALANLSVFVRPLARHFRGQQRLAATDIATVQAGIIDLIYPAAIDSSLDDRGIAAAGLAIASQKQAILGDQAGADALTKERVAIFPEIAAKDRVATPAAEK